MSVICPNNHQNRQGARFCQTCGAPLRQPAPAPQNPPASLPSRDQVVMRVQGTELSPSAAASGSLVRPPTAHSQSRPYISSAARAGQVKSGWAAAIPLTMVLLGGVAVLAGFFLGWLAFSLPALSLILGAAAPITISGYDLLMKGPGTYRSIPLVLVVLIPGLGALALILIALRAMPGYLWRRVSGAASILLGVAGLVALAVLLTSARSEPEQLMTELGLKGAMPSLLSAALVRIEPALGYAVNLVGFILLVLGGLGDLVVQTRLRQQAM